MNNKLPKKKKKRLEFYQKWLVVCLVTTIAACFCSYLLAFLGLNTVSELSMSLVDKMMTVDIISMLGYAGQNSVRAWAADKYGFPKNDSNEAEG